MNTTYLFGGIPKSSEYSMNQILKKYIVTMLLVTKLLIYNLDVLMGIFSPLCLYIRGQPSYKSHQTIKPSKVGFDKHLRMAFYDLRNERITCGNKVSVFWKVLFYLVQNVMHCIEKKFLAKYFQLKCKEKLVLNLDLIFKPRISENKPQICYNFSL